MNSSLLRLLSFFAVFILADQTIAADAVAIWHDQGSCVTDWLKTVWKENKFTSELNVVEGVDMEVALFKQRDESDLRPDAVMVISNLIGLKDAFHFSKVDRDFSKGVGTRFHETVIRNGTDYGIPLFASNFLILIYRKSFFDKPPSDLILSHAEWPFYAPFYFCSFYSPISDAPLNEEILKAALKSYVETVKMLQLDPHCGDDCIWKRFVDKKASAIVTQSSRLAEVAKDPDIAYTILPPASGSALHFYSGTYVLAFPNNSLQGPRATVLRTFAKRLVEKSNQERLFSKCDKVSVRTDVQKQFLKFGTAVEKFQIQTLMKSEKLPNFPEMASFWPAIRKGVHIAFQKNSAEGAQIASQLYLEYTQKMNREIRSAEPVSKKKKEP
ncbi:MAG: hypothetical protein ACXVCY_00040 [Pseudobdellovibrionaceae bacterium]